MRRLCLVTVALVAFAAATLAHADDVTLRIAITGGVEERVQTKYAVSRLMADTGVTVEWVEGNAPDFLQKLVASKGRPVPFDIVELDDKTQPRAIGTGALMKLDPSIVTNLAFVYDLAKQKDGYGPGFLFWSWGLFYNAQAFREHGIPEPTSWNDLWNPLLAGKVAIADIAGPGGVDFILKVAELTGGGQTNLIVGLHKIAELKVQSFFPSSNDLRAKFLSGDVWVAPWNNGRSWDMIDSGFPGRFIYPKEGGYLHTSTIDVVAGTKHPKEAQLYVNYLLDPLSQLGHAYENPFGPTNKTLEGILAAYPEVAKKFVTMGVDLKQVTMLDWRDIEDNSATLVDNWNRIVKAQ